MSDIDTFKQELTELETGLGAPDPGAIRSRGRTRRRRRHAAVVAACALVTVGVVAPLALGSQESDRGREETPPVAEQSVAPEVVGPEFGPAMQAAVESRFPNARRTTDQVADHLEWIESERVLRAEADDPVTWESVILWYQTYALGDGVELSVEARRDGPMAPPVSEMNTCEKWGPPTRLGSRVGCSDEELDGLHLIFSDGLTYESTPGTWTREVLVVGGPMERDMPMRTLVQATVSDVGTWDEAQQLMPDMAELRDLALDPAVHLPEPQTYRSDSPR